MRLRILPMSQVFRFVALCLFCCHWIVCLVFIRSFKWKFPNMNILLLCKQGKIILPQWIILLNPNGISLYMGLTVGTYIYIFWKYKLNFKAESYKAILSNQRAWVTNSGISLNHSTIWLTFQTFLASLWATLLPNHGSNWTLYKLYNAIISLMSIRKFPTVEQEISCSKSSLTIWQLRAH